MTTEYISGCINHKDIRHIRIYYDYMDIYNYNEEKAKIVRIIETWTDSKRAQWYKENYDRLERGEALQEPDFWITMSHQQFREFMRFSSNAETIKRYLAELEKANHIKRRINPDNPYGAPQYLLNCKAIQKAIDKLATPPYIPVIPTQDTPQENIDPPHKPTPPPGVQITPTLGDKPTPPLGGKLPPPWGENTPPSNITTKNDSNDNIITEREGANVPTRAEISQQKEVVDEKLEEVKTASGKHKVVSSHSQCLQEDEQPTVKLAAMKGVSHADRVISPALPAESRDSGTHPGQHVALQRATAAQTLIPEPVHADGAASAALPLGGAISATSSGPRRRGKSPVPQRPPQLTLEGVQAKEWYEEIRDVKVRMTAGNVKDLNDLGECEGLSKHSLAAMIEHLENKKWVKDNQVAISLHMLSGNDARFAFLSFEENWSLIKRKLNGKKPQSRPTLDEVECIDERWCVYKRPGDDQEWILWQGELCTPEEADERGYAGGGGLYIQTQYAK